MLEGIECSLVLSVASRQARLIYPLGSDIPESVQMPTRDSICDENAFDDPQSSVQSPNLAFTMALFLSYES